MKTILITILICLNSYAHAVTDKDRGGGNSYQGKPLESYIQNPKELTAYKDQLQGLQKALFPFGYFDRYFDHALTHKTWYFVPGPLRKISPKTIGAVVRTDQVALQGFDSVWIDRDLFNKMSLDDQTNLLLHEILISLKLLRFESMRDQCLSIISSSNAYQCDDASTVRYGTPADLTPEDYEEVRQTVLYLRNLPATATYSSVQDLFHRRHFSFRFSPFETIGHIRGYWGSEIIQKISDSYLANFWPKNLFRFSDFYKIHPEQENQPLNNSYTWKKEGHCSLDKFTFEQDRLKGRYRSQNGNKAALDFALDFEIKENTLYGIGQDILNTLSTRQRTFFGSTTLIRQAVPGKRSLGDRILNMEFLMNDDGNFDGVHVTEFVIVREATEQNKNERYMQVFDGIDEICSIHQNINLTP